VANAFAAFSNALDLVYDSKLDYESRIEVFQDTLLDIAAINGEAETYYVSERGGSHAGRGRAHAGLGWAGWGWAGQFHPGQNSQAPKCRSGCPCSLVLCRQWTRVVTRLPLPFLLTPGSLPPAWSCC